MRILFITDYFPPEVSAPAWRTFDHCRRWAEAGHEVRVVTCAPNFPRGRVFEGYRNRLYQREMMDGIEVIRIWTYMAQNTGFVLRTLDNLSFMVAGFFGGLLGPRPDVIVATSPQIFTPVAARGVSFLRRVPWVFELRDIWPESIAAVGAMRSGLVLNLLEKLELSLYRRAARVVALTYGFRENLVRRGIDEHKIDVVTNGVDLAQFQPGDASLRAELELGDKFVVGYFGTIGMAHGLSTVIDAAALLAADPEGRDIEFLFVGEGADRAALEHQADELALTNVRFRDYVPKAEIVRYWGVVDAALIHLKRSPTFRTVIPSKMFECMAMGVPIVMGVEGEAAAMVERHDVGLCFEPGNPRALADAVLALKKDNLRFQSLIANAKSAALQYDRSRLADAMLDTLKSAARVP
jgi:glycosyltransferase involved in cell wall biosynthesis